MYINCFIIYIYICIYTLYVYIYIQYTHIHMHIHKIVWRKPRTTTRASRSVRNWRHAQPSRWWSVELWCGKGLELPVSCDELRRIADRYTYKLRVYKYMCICTYNDKNALIMIWEWSDNDGNDDKNDAKNDTDYIYFLMIMIWTKLMGIPYCMRRYDMV